jgi:hypothetical protein
MNFASYPRPAGDTGIGFHWFPDTKHYEKAHLKRFGAELKALGASWLVAHSGISETLPEHFVKELRDRNVEPIVHLRTPFVAPVDQSELGKSARQHAKLGVQYILLYDSPNMQGEWAKWPAANVADAFMDFALPGLETMAQVDGLIPLFPPLRPGGDVNDRLFLDRCLGILAARGSEGLKGKLALAIQNDPGNKPLTWGRGAGEAWPASIPGHCPEGSEDHTGYCLYEWYQEIAQKRLGRSVIMAAVRNGPTVGDRSHPAYPPVDASRHAILASEMAQSLMDSQAPYYLLNTAFWLLAAEDGDPFAAHRWYRPDGAAALPKTVKALKALAKHARPVLSIPASIQVLMEDGKVVSMALEEYVKGVIPREIPATGPMEALKAQAIAARTFAAKAIQRPRHGATAVCTTSHCQNWSAKSHSRTDQAVKETDGVVLAYGGDVIGAYYFGHCDGHTRNSEDVWRAALPYCRSVPCTCGNVEMYGHGVGMCQEGAMRMAGQGALAHEILEHYYTGVRVQRADGTPYQE